MMVQTKNEIIKNDQAVAKIQVGPSAIYAGNAVEYPAGHRKDRIAEPDAGQRSAADFGVRGIERRGAFGEPWAGG